MKQFLVFYKKEFYEGMKTKRLMISGIVFIILGIMNPFIAKVTPEIMKNALPKGVTIKLAEPTSLDSWTQFFKNINQLGVIVLLILFCEILSKEVERGTLIPLLTKGLSRRVVILSKLFYMWSVWTVVLLISFFITYGYTIFYFPDNLSVHLFSAIFSLWIFGMLLFALLLFSSILTRSGFQGLMIVAVFYAVGLFSVLFTKIDTYNPFVLSTKNMDFLKGTASFDEYYPAVLISFLLIILCLVAAVKQFDKKKI
ncbi:MAG: ABC transporter permease [Enterococcus sp.]